MSESQRSPRRRSEDETFDTTERLQRVLASRGVASRRASETMIQEGRVRVNGEVVTTLGTKVDPQRDEIKVDGKRIPRQATRYIILNKPSGFITTVSDERQRRTVMDLVQVPERVYPVGRLDRATQGLLLLTNDGEIANRVMHPRYGLTKEYHVLTSRKPHDRQLQRLRDGVKVDGRTVVPDECRILRETREGVLIKLVLHEGLYHVVRKMMEAVGIDVGQLRRERLGPLQLHGIPHGAWRDVSAGELLQLYEALGLPRDQAERVNATRPIQTEPVGGFRHGEGPAADTAQPHERSGSKDRNGAPGRNSTRQRPGSGPRAGRPHDRSRPPSGHRDRRTGRRR